MLAIPPEMLETMSVKVGTVFDVSIENGALVAKPAKAKYSLKQLLAEEQAVGIDALAEVNTEWAEAPPMGREKW